MANDKANGFHLDGKRLFWEIKVAMDQFDQAGLYCFVNITILEICPTFLKICLISMENTFLTFKALNKV